VPLLVGGGSAGANLAATTLVRLRDRHDVVIAPLTGPEVITGSTRMKAGTATKLVLNSITTAAMVLLGKVHGNLMVDLRVSCTKLQDRGERILMATLGLGRDDARELLALAGGHVKTALAMHRLQLGANEARKALDEVNGVVSALGSPEAGGG